MVVHNNNMDPKAALQELLGGTQNQQNSNTSDLFSTLLASLAEGMKSEKNLPEEKTSTPFNVIVDPKKTEKKSTLQHLLSGNDDPRQLFSQELLGSLGNDQIRMLIHRAKEYLKQQITAASPEISLNAKGLPKTLGGLVQLADKMGLNPQSITLSTVLTEPEEKAAIAPALLTQPLLDAKRFRGDSSAAPLPSAVASPFERIAHLLNASKATAPDAPLPTEKGVQEAEPTLSVLLKGLDSPSKNTPVKDSAGRNGLTKMIQPDSTLSALLQGMDSASGTAAIKDPSNKEKIKKEGALSQPLSSLLHGLDNAPAPAPAPLRPAAESKEGVSSKTDGLMALLQGEPKREEEVKGEGATKSDSDLSKLNQPLKADALEVKAKEAVQGLRHFAADLKEGLENYKSPFTRLSMKLNPEKLGEVEVTLVQRGNNVHVNIQSNTLSSVAFLAQNATELKAQLAHQGITNTTMNFMSGGEGQSQNPHQQQHHQQQQNVFKSYQSLEQLELNNEQLSALEIILPHYA